MSLWDQITRFLAIEPQQNRTLTLAEPFTDLDTQFDDLTRWRRQHPWQAPSVRAALGVPAILRCVSLISSTIGSMSLNGYRDGTLLPPEERPRIIIRPDPFRKPFDFFRDTGWNMATMGEAWWWVAKRDADGSPLSLLNVNPVEVTVEPNVRNPLKPVIQWNGVTMANDDMRQLTLFRLPGELRGVGPLQLCGAAVSVSVESQEWAANFYADGGTPSVVIRSAVDLDPTRDAAGESEADRLRNQWVSVAHNTPRVIDPGIESVDEFGVNTAAAQMLDARNYQSGEAARMFGIPGSILDYAQPGASLTYQNLEGEFGKWVRAGLWPYYLEPMEQEMSDLLTRSTVARFNVDGLFRADIKTRYEVYQIGINSGVLTPELAQEMEGIIAGNVETAPVPFAAPQAIPSDIPGEIRTEPVRCDGQMVRRGLLTRCNKLLAEAGTFIGTCPRCHKGYGVA